MFLMNPILALVHNRKANTWHTLVLEEAPFPGPFDANKPTRHKSKGHHTTGNKNRDEEIQYAKDVYGRIVEEHGMKAKYAFDEDLSWDGEGIPAMSLLTTELPDGTIRFA